ncbi:hypothetical protein WJX84_003196 [Apatococcus fuscideae]|uniref:Uncharacterized protein n=1 Tax=Apatococcus fuscideae TaxID=2026836 RepID=A0AAW1SLB8_9CHLO
MTQKLLTSQGTPSQATTVDPVAEQQKVKHDLHLKASIPGKLQRLFFQVPTNPEVAEDDTATQTQELLDDLRAGLTEWQAILYQDGKALGRLVQPRIATDICSAADAEDEAAFKATLLAELQYHLWQPAAEKDIPPRALQILLDAHFKESSYSIKVFGQARGALFPVPLPYHLSGQRTTAAVSFAYQQQQYIRRQQLRWHTADSSPAPTGEISSVTVVCGSSPHSFTATFNTKTAPASLSSVNLSLRFVLVAAFTPEHASAKPLTDPAMEHQRKKFNTSIYNPALAKPVQQVLPSQHPAKKSRPSSFKDNGEARDRDHLDLRDQTLAAVDAVDASSDAIRELVQKSSNSSQPVAASTSGSSGFDTVQRPAKPGSSKGPAATQGMQRRADLTSSGSLPRDGPDGQAVRMHQQPGLASQTPAAMGPSATGPSWSEGHEPKAPLHSAWQQDWRSDAVMHQRRHRSMPTIFSPAMPSQPPNAAQRRSEHSKQPGNPSANSAGPASTSGSSLDTATPSEVPRASNSALSAQHGPVSASQGQQIDLPKLHETAQVEAPSQGTDIERFLERATPVLEVPSHAGTGVKPELCLADVWEFFRQPSLYGQEVMTLGGKRGLSQAYYLPSMSAMQLFLPAGAHEGIGAHRPPYQLYSHEADWGPRWSPHMRPLAELFEQELPFERPPLFSRIADMASGLLSDGLDGHLLLDKRLADLHPASWFAVAWYPIYRIPDAPLNARFLTFHSLHPQPHPSTTAAGASRMSLPVDGGLLGVACENGSLRAFDLRSGERSFNFQNDFPQGEPMTSVLFNPAKEYEIFGSAAKRICCFDLRQGSDQAPVSSLECNQDDINQLAINPKGTYLAAADDTGSIQIVALQQAMSPFKHLHGGHQNICSTVAFRAHKHWEGKCQPFLLSPLHWMPNHS